MKNFRKLFAVLAILSILLSGCGAAEFTYVKNSEDKAYFKVPAEWKQIDSEQLFQLETSVDPDSATAEVLRSMMWSRAYDADPNPSAAHLLVGTSDEPFVYFTIWHLSETQQNSASLDYLRDFILPVTVSARAAVPKDSELNSFELLLDEPKATAVVHGVRVIFNYRYKDGPISTFDMLAYLSNDNSKVYLAMLRCTATCYKESNSKFADIVTSLTVRG